MGGNIHDLLKYTPPIAPRLPRYHPHHHHEAQRKVDQAVGDETNVTYRTRPAGRHQLRGIPITTRGVGGTQPGTNPLNALLDKHRTSHA